METNSKVLNFFHKYQFGSGIYFWSFFFVYTISLLILSIDQNWAYVVILSIGIGIFALFQKSLFFWILLFLPLCIYLQINSIGHLYVVRANTLEKLIKNQEIVEGEVQSISGVKNGSIYVTLQTKRNENYQIRIPVQRGLKFWDYLNIIPEKNESLSKFYISRGVAGVFISSRVVIVENTEKTVLQRIKNTLLSWIKKSYPQPEQWLIAWILLWDPSLMSEEINGIFRKIGLSHITVVSGSNISFLLVSILLFLFFIPQRIKIPIAIIGIILYIGMVGWDPPVLRAWIMWIIAALWLLLPGKIDSFRILALTCLILLILSPYSLVYDPWFQLSFLATIGILIVWKIFPNISQWRQAILISIFACLWTLPITIGVFWNFHTWSILANIFVWPLVWISMTLSIIWWILWTFWEFGGYWVTFLSYASLHGIVIIAEYFSPLPYQWEFDKRTSMYLWFISFWAISGLTYQYQYLRRQSLQVFSEFEKQ